MTAERGNDPSQELSFECGPCCLRKNQVRWQEQKEQQYLIFFWAPNGKPLWGKVWFCVGSQWPHTLFDAWLSVVLFLCNFSHLSFLFPLGFSFRGEAFLGDVQSISCGLFTGWIRQGMFLISAGRPHATQLDLSKTLFCHICLGLESHSEFLHSGLCLRKTVMLGD